MELLGAGIYTLVTQHPVISGLVATGVILYVSAPALFAKGKAALVTTVEKLIEQKVGVKLDLPGNDTVAATGTLQTLAVESDDEVIRRRLSEYKAACPKASAELRMAWAEKGLSVDLARDAYIKDLEAQQKP